MHLHIFGDAITTTVSGITLKDGCLPSIGDYTHNPRDFLLEPSIWFKVQLLDAVSVDCSRRQLSWEVIRQDEGIGDSTELSDKDDDGGIISFGSDSGLLTSVCAEEFLALDEVFDGLPILDCSYRNNAISASQFYEGIVKLLHLYILPSVYLSAAHVHALRSALREQTFILQTIDEEIDSVSRKFESVSQTKKGLRQKFVLGASEGDEIVAYSGSMLALLASEIDDDIREMGGSLEVAQDKVNRRKQLATDADGLAEARRSRDEILRIYEAWLSAREDIVLRGKRARESPRKRRIRSFDSKARRPAEHGVYAELTLLQEELNAKMRSLTDKKVMATGVVESMRRTREELRGGKESFGTDLSGGGHTDDLDRSPKPWATLAEQVRQVLSNSDHVIAATHVTFCACVVARCRAACNERILYETDFGRGADSEVTGSSSRSPTSENSKSNCSDAPDQRQSIFTAECSRGTQETVVKPGGENPYADYSVPLSPPVSSKISKSRRDFFRKRKKSTTIIPPNSPTGVSNAGPSSPSAVATVRLLDSSYDADAVLIFDEKTDYAKRAIDGLKRDIGHHFETVTESLRRELKQRSETSIWLSYENAFYHETMEDLLTLYGLELNAVTRAIGQSIRSLKASDLKFEDSKIAEMLEEDEVVSVQIQDDKTPEGRFDRVETQPKLTKTVDFDDCSSEEEVLRPLPKAVDAKMTVKELIRRFSGVGVEKDRASLVGRSRLRPTRSVREQNELLRDSSFSAVTVRKSLQLSHLLKNSMVFDQKSTLENAQSVIRECSCLEGPGFLPPTKQPDRGCKTSRRAMTLKPEMKHNFRRAFDCLSLAVEARSLSAKFKQLTRCLREVSQQISAFGNRLKARGGGEKGPGGDELMDGVIVLLCNLDESMMAQLYVQITMLVDLMPPFFKCSSFNFALVQFFTAFQFVKQQISQKIRSRSGRDDATSSYK